MAEPVRILRTPHLQRLIISVVLAVLAGCQGYVKGQTYQVRDNAAVCPTEDVLNEEFQATRDVQSFLKRAVKVKDLGCWMLNDQDEVNIIDADPSAPLVKISKSSVWHAQGQTGYIFSADLH